jgi:hypothetical protein
MLALIELLTQMWLRGGGPGAHPNDKALDFGGAADTGTVSAGANIRRLADTIKIGRLVQRPKKG